jgi:hypothetical protein
MAHDIKAWNIRTSGLSQEISGWPQQGLEVHLRAKLFQAPAVAERIQSLRSRGRLQLAWEELLEFQFFDNAKHGIIVGHWRLCALELFAQYASAAAEQLGLVQVPAELLGDVRFIGRIPHKHTQLDRELPNEEAQERYGAKLLHLAKVRKVPGSCGVVFG